MDKKAKANVSKAETHDPVCGMDVSEFIDSPSFLYKNETFYFCSEACKSRFEKTPEKFFREPLIHLIDVSKIFKMGDSETRALQRLDLHIWEGDFVSIIGASGSGKSTCLNMIGLLDLPTSGKVLLGGKDTAKLSDEERAELRSKTFGFVFQQYNLIPWLNAYENVTLPLIFANKKIEKDKMEPQFKNIGMLERVSHRPFELSGGEQQRIAFLRALANEPEIIIGDEPTGNLDSATGAKLLDLLISLNKEEKKTLIIVTHDASIAEKADQIVAIKDGHLVRDHMVHKKTYVGK